MLRVAKCLHDRIEQSSIKLHRQTPMIYLVGNKSDLGCLSSYQECTDLRMSCDSWTSLRKMEINLPFFKVKVKYLFIHL